MVYENISIPTQTGNLTTWRKYHKEYFQPLNRMFADSLGEEFVAVREKLNLKIELMTDWEPWGICEVCGRPQGNGLRRKKGHCRLKIDQLNNNVRKAKTK